MERDLARMTMEDLTQLARQQGLRGYSTMTKTELVDALGAYASDMPLEAADEESPAVRPEARKVTTAGTPATTTLESVVDAEAPARADAPVAATGLEVGETEAADAIADDAEAVEEVRPEPQFKKTWIRHELLIDDPLPELPESYGDEKLVVMVRDPYWVHAYWDLRPETVDRVHAQGGQRMALRVYDVTDLVFDGRNAHHWFEIPAPEYVRNWTINVPSDGRNYLIELGWVKPDGNFLSVLRSDLVDVPIGRPSPVIADKFVSLPFHPAPEVPTSQAPVETPAVTEEELAPPAPAPAQDLGIPLPETMYQLSTKGRGYWSADTPRYGDLTWDHLESAMGSHRMGSHGLSSFSAPPAPPAETKAKDKDKDFWLVANCELIVYGATEADATVTLRGQKIELRPDGTFSIRFAFPDGLHPIPIHAVNADGDMERSITITVSRDTQA